MVSNSLWTNKTRGGRDTGYHVESSILLALIRGQKFEGDERARAHLALCKPCQRAYVELSQTSRTLDVLGQMALSQQYPEMQAEAILARAQRRFPGRVSRPVRQPVRNAYRPRRSTMQWVSLPAFAVVLLIMAIVVMLTFALVQLNSGYFPFHGPFFGPSVVNNSPTPPSLAPQVITPVIPTRSGAVTPTPGTLTSVTPTTVPAVTPTIRPTVTPSPTATLSTSPSIGVCTTAADYAARYLDICGINFKSFDTIQLVVSAPAYRQPAHFSTSTNAYGQFTYRFKMYTCKFDPVALYAKDMTSTPVIYSNTLVNITTAGCTTPTGTATPTPGDH